MTITIYSKVSKAIFDTDMVGVRLILFLGELFWAIGFLWPGDSIAEGVPMYTIMGQLGGDIFWGAVFLLSAITQLTIVLLEDYQSRFAMYFAGWNGCLWTFSCLGAMISVYPPALMGGELACAVAAIWLWLRPFVLQYGEMKIAE